MRAGKSDDAVRGGLPAARHWRAAAVLENEEHPFVGRVSGRDFCQFGSLAVNGINQGTAGSVLFQGAGNHPDGVPDIRQRTAGPQLQDRDIGRLQLGQHGRRSGFFGQHHQVGRQRDDPLRGQGALIADLGQVFGCRRIVTGGVVANQHLLGFQRIDDFR